MDIRKCELFVLTAETENISKTAELSGYTQSGVSHLLKAFEKEVGVTLFKRDRYGVHLTPVGNELLPLVRGLVRENEKVRQFIFDLKGIEAGQLYIGTTENISNNYLPTILQEFHSFHPNVSFKTKNGSPSDIEQMLTTNQIDIGLIDCPFDSSYEKILIPSNIILSVLVKDKTDLSPIAQKFILSIKNMPYEIK